MAKKRQQKKPAKPSKPSSPSMALIPYVSPADQQSERERIDREFEEREARQEKTRYNQKLTRQMQTSVCMMIAQGFGDRYIADRIMVEYQTRIDWSTINEVYRHGKRWRPIISYFRNKWITNTSRHAASRPGYRLSMLQRGIEIAIESGNIKALSALVKAAKEEMTPSSSVPLEPGDVMFQHTQIFKGMSGEEFRRMPLENRIQALNDALQNQRR